MVENTDGPPELKLIREVDTCTYVFHVPGLLSARGKMKNNNAQAELYLTDVPALIKEAGGRVGRRADWSAGEMLGGKSGEEIQGGEANLRKGGVSRG